MVIPACEGLRVHVLDISALAEADGLPTCDLDDSVAVEPSSGLVYIPSTVLHGFFVHMPVRSLLPLFARRHSLVRDERGAKEGYGDRLREGS